MPRGTRTAPAAMLRRCTWPCVRAWRVREYMYVPPRAAGIAQHETHSGPDVSVPTKPQYPGCN
eukprot:COSAG02_NODE_530_length_20697_cov_20.103457_5_plen_63_part_00